MESTINLDTVLLDLGHFGRFQKKNYVLICLVIAFSCLPMGYIFTTRSSNYRCYIENCENVVHPTYKTDWLQNAVPFKDDNPKRCFKYSSNSTDTCNKEDFDAREIICDKFVFENGDLTIERDFNVTCDENLWKLTIVGTINNIGELACLPLSGYVSDRYGRRTMMIVSVLLSTVCGLLKSFSPTYLIYVLMEFLDTSLGSGTYSAAYILAIELVIPEQRVLGNTLLACAFAIGEALLGIGAWSTNSWRSMLRFLYTPGVLFIFYYRFTHESVRWLMSKGRYEETKDILKQVAKTNGTELSENVIKKLNVQVQEGGNTGKTETMRDIVATPVLLGRLVNCSFGWMCCTFVYYGLTMHSVSISGNLYFNFVTVALIEIPAYFVSYCTLDKIGRKFSQSGSLLLSGLACIAFVFIPAENTTVKLILFLIGKFCVTIAYTTLYIYTTEMFPTNLRHSLLAICSMFGRFGSMVAPQIPLLARLSPSLPLILFGTMATASSILTLLFPETLNTKLPDTINEAVFIGNKQI